MGNSVRAIWVWTCGILLLLSLLLIRLFYFNTFYIGNEDILPEGVQKRSLMIVSYHKEVRDRDELLVISLHDDKGGDKLFPARLLRFSGVKPDELQVDIGGTEIWITKHQVRGSVIAQIKLP